LLESRRLAVTPNSNRQNRLEFHRLAMTAGFPTNPPSKPPSKPEKAAVAAHF
jgi:hypothetical protein